MSRHTALFYIFVLLFIKRYHTIKILIAVVSSNCVKIIFVYYKTKLKTVTKFTS